MGFARAIEPMDCISELAAAVETFVMDGIARNRVQSHEVDVLVMAAAVLRQANADNHEIMKTALLKAVAIRRQAATIAVAERVYANREGK